MSHTHSFHLRILLSGYRFSHVFSYLHPKTSIPKTPLHVFSTRNDGIHIYKTQSLISLNSLESFTCQGTDQLRRAIFKRIPFLPSGRPPPNPSAPQSCVSSRKRRSFEVPGSGGLQKGRGRVGRGKKEGKKNVQEVVRATLIRGWRF